MGVGEDYCLDPGGAQSTAIATNQSIQANSVTTAVTATENFPPVPESASSPLQTTTNEGIMHDTGSIGSLDTDQSPE